MNREQTEGSFDYLKQYFFFNASACTAVDLKAFELRLTECVGHIRAKTRKWRCKHVR